ncbi:septal ring lytic transglycosylase RlpA family protein [Ferrimicrobium sp.]|uniref:septal ring lytic transglycosylase RlpA family protein n=1 Tax=Ferrimicrobium sp. TaxID=2926050 RepID=UPI00260CA4FC|nr:septal ring lytic transglycosylase RlpA family protein [Ferrimicrobium sp.]
MSRAVPISVGVASLVATSWAVVMPLGSFSLTSDLTAGRQLPTAHTSASVGSGVLPVLYSSTSKVTLLNENGLAVIAGLGSIADATAGMTQLAAPPPPPPGPLPIPLPVVTSPPPPPPPPPPEYSQSGVVSWYGSPAGTCASPGLPFGTVVTVTNANTGASTQCVVNDRGPYVGGRILDLSPASFANIAPLGQGLTEAVLHWQ